MRPRSILIRTICAAAFTLPLLALSQEPGLTPPVMPTESAATVAPPTPAAGPRPLTKEDVEAWIDGFLPYALERGDVPGAMIAVVKDGQVLLQKGYGYADVAARKPVDPERTLFRPGSVSKLFTWTAVMQQVEQRKIDLDADVNTYLDYKIPPRGAKPVTMRNLMTHTAGFDETVRGLITSNPQGLMTLEQMLKSRIPPRVTDAGTTPAYSNYGAALAGYIVARVSGESFDDYIERHVFAPLGITHGTFRQPLPANFEPDMAKGYKPASVKPELFEMIPAAPAGSLSITASDMARFMIAHLNKGAFGSERILQEATAVQMHATGNEIIPPLHRMMLGFYETDINGHDVIAHGGDTNWFHSDLNLFINDGVALFISMNSRGKDGAAGPIRSAFFEEFANRYFPAPLPEGSVDAKIAKEHAQLMAGNYVLSRRPHENFLSLLNLIGQAKVIANSDDTISVVMLKGTNGEPKKFREIAPFVWRDVNGGERLAAKVENGRVLRFGYDPYPFMIFEPTPASWSSIWLLPLWIGALVALALTALAWPISALVRRRYGVAYELTGTDARAHRWVRIASLLVLALMLAWLAVIIIMLEVDLEFASPSKDGLFIFLRLLSVLVFIGGAAIAFWNAAVVLRGPRRRLAKVWSVVLAIACVVVVYVAAIFHLFGYTANY